jgi:hypothetical protein
VQPLYTGSIQKNPLKGQTENKFKKST